MSMRKDSPVTSASTSMDSYQSLNRLSVASSCGAFWEGMEGNFRERHCSRCEKQVHDFRRLTADEIEARLRTHPGGLCARLTHSPAGELLFRQPAPPQEMTTAPRELRRAQPAAAWLLSALLGAASASPQSPSGDGVEIGAALDPEVEEVPPGEPGEELAGGEEFFDENGGAVEVSMGIIVMPPDPLHAAFAASPLVVLATVGETVALEKLDEVGDYGDAVGELEIDLLLRGTPVGEAIQLRYEVTVVACAEEGRTEVTAYPEGTVLLAFLEPDEDETDPSGTYWRSTREPQVLTAEEALAYRSRLESLAALLSARGFDSPDAVDAELPPDELQEWLVGTIEEPSTRDEAIDEIDADELTEEQRDRLTAALLATKPPVADDLSLFHLVRQWAPTDALLWLRESGVDLEPNEAGPVQ